MCLPTDSKCVTEQKERAAKFHKELIESDQKSGCSLKLTGALTMSESNIVIFYEKPCKSSPFRGEPSSRIQFYSMSGICPISLSEDFVHPKRQRR